MSDVMTKWVEGSTYGALHAFPSKFDSPYQQGLLGFLKIEVVYSSPARSVAFAIWGPVEARSAETHTSHDQSPFV
jgi:hypothetical protein